MGGSMEVADEVTSAVSRLRDTFTSGRTRDVRWRLAQLLALVRCVEVHRDELTDALQADLGVSPFLSTVNEVERVLVQARHARRNVRQWARHRTVHGPAVLVPGKTRWRPEPYGVVIIYGTWNYPMSMVLLPLIGALAAGNCAVIKVSELSPNVSGLLARLVPKYLDRGAVAVIEGGMEAVTALYAHQWDYIFFTGSREKGKMVAAQAAKTLTPCTLELGGKCPVVVGTSADLKVAARRTVLGKFGIHAGQTCVAPDHVLAIGKGRAEAFAAEAKRCIAAMFGSDPAMSADYGRIINSPTTSRLQNLLASSGGTVVSGGVCDVEARYFSPTVVLLDRGADSTPLMQEEIFGPILPVVAVDALDDALALVNHRSDPLVVYCFTRDAREARKLREETRSGAFVQGEVMLQMVVPDIPFGGVGESGHGCYHGVWSFETFSRIRAYHATSTWLDPFFKYPPYSGLKKKILKVLFAIRFHAIRMGPLSAISLALAPALAYAFRHDLRRATAGILGWLATALATNGTGSYGG